MFILLLLQEEAFRIFIFDWEKIQNGEYWRVVSFLAIPPVGLGGSPMFGVLFMFIALMIGYLISDSLERAWGVFRTSLYVYGILACVVLATFLFRDRAWVPISGGAIFYQAIFLAFATVFPRFEFRLFFILPVQVWVLGVVAGVIIVLSSLESFEFAIYSYICFLPYLVWAFPRFLRWGRTRSQTAARQASFRTKAAPTGTIFHECESCGATDQSHPDRDFRVTEDHRELCEDCLKADSGGGKPAREAG